MKRLNEELRRVGILLEEGIINGHKKQDYEILSKKNEAEIILKDRGLISTRVFIRNMIKDEILKEDEKELVKNHEQFESSIERITEKVILWGTEEKEMIKRLRNRNRSNEKENVEYFIGLRDTYLEEFPKLGEEIQIIGKQTLYKEGSNEEKEFLEKFVKKFK
ncbi:6593_t:CDS:1 [Diversispora eburnea]|uniref:6593_t:CDS:1 n=1 Tax=Diversispora eburnea TaxID=1213867 RepID=A0A9N9GFZ1_9GLOM|nr:6593_t:CDS:1 [Diversispora eburnea]